MTHALTLPFLLALAVALHALLSHGAKALLSSTHPLATGEPEAGGYQRRVYSSPERAMLEVVGLVLAAGVCLWVGMTWGWAWVGGLGGLLLISAVALDLARWERVVVSASYVWFQRGLGHAVHQVAIENILDVNVVERDVRGYSLRYLNRNRECRLTMRMKDKRLVALPKTDAHRDLGAVETVANLIRARQHLSRTASEVQRAGERGRDAAAAAARQPPSTDRELLRELKRLRQKSQGPDLPASAKRTGEA